jgi:Tfp pilus assembly protein PilF
VLKLVPSHYQSWSNLGVVLMSLKKREEAERCLKRALSLRPDYEVARKNLAMMDARP